MKFLTSMLWSDRDRAAKKRRSLQVNLNRLDEKAFLLEMELEETKREREKVLKELQSKVPIRHVSTVSSTEFSFNTTDNSNAERYCGYPIDSSTPNDEKIRMISWKNKEKAKMYAKEEEERATWTNQDMKDCAQEKNDKKIEKY